MAVDLYYTIIRECRESGRELSIPAMVILNELLPKSEIENNQPISEKSIYNVC